MPLPGDLETSWQHAIDDSDPLRALRAARDVRESLMAWEAHLARAALGSGETWETIGAALGISRQAAWERLGRVIKVQIEADRTRLRAERARLREERNKRWSNKP